MSVRLFVGNLPYSANEVDIRQHFGTVGDPLQIVIPTDRDTGRPRGFAFVDYDDRAVAERAIQQLHGQPFKGRPLSVSEARPREARPPMGGGGGFSRPPMGGGGGFSRPPMGGGGGFSRPPMGGGGDAGPYRQPRGVEPTNRNFGPNKPPRGRGNTGFAKNRNQEGKVKGPLKELRTGRMFSVDEDSRFKDDDDLGVEDVELNPPDDDKDKKDDEE
jgi:RNA recognition motif-containing protein